MSHEVSQLYEFDAFRLDPAERQLLRDGQPVALTPKVFETLVALVERRGHLVEKEELMKLVWAEAFVEEANLARSVHTLRKALGEEHNGHKYIETVPKRGYRFVAEVRQIANGGSHAATPDQAEAATENLNGAATKNIKLGNQQDTEVAANDFALPPRLPVAPSPLLATPRRRLSVSVSIIPLALVVAAAVIGAYFYFNRVRRVAADQTPINSIAVLPFANVGADPEVEYLSDGLSESLINRLSQLPGLSVKARSTVFRYKGKEVEPQQVGAELNVQAILNGRVVQRGDDLALSLSLVDARNGNQLWGEQYERKLADLVSLQSEVARDVSDKLRQKLTGADAQKLAKAPTENAEAYQLYLRGKFYQSKGAPESLRKAIEYFQQAIALDSNFALAYVGLASSYASLAHFNNAAARDLRLKAKAAALNALAIDDQLLEARVAFGDILYKDEYDFAGAEREFKRAVEQHPNDADAHQAYGELLMCLGRHEESLAELRRALAIDPVSSGANGKYGLSLFFARRYDEAIAQGKKTLELDDTYWWARRGLAFSYQLKRDYAESVAERVKMSESTGKPQLAALMRESFAKGGWRGFLRDMTARQRPPDLPLYIVATYHVELGEKDKALAILNQMYEDRATELVTLKVDPRLDSLRGDSRFQELLRRVGLP